jgi:hypothetical protein
MVVTDKGTLGYVWDDWLFLNPPEPDAKLHKISSGESPIGIAERYYKGAVGWGHDLRFYVNVLVYANRAEGDRRKGIHKDNKDDSWRETKTRAGAYIWVPSTAFADSLRGKVKSESITYELWQAVVEVWEWVKFGLAFVGGLLHGAFSSVWDTVTGVFDLLELIWDLLKSIFTGEIISDAKALWDAITWEKVKDVVSDWFADAKAKWTSSNPWVRGHYQGYVTGYIIAEVLLAIFTAGATVEIKAASKLGKAIKLLKTLKPVAKAIDKAEDVVKKGKAAYAKAKKALRSARARRRMHAALGKNAAKFLDDVGEEFAEELLDAVGDKRLRELVEKYDGAALKRRGSQFWKDLKGVTKNTLKHVLVGEGITKFGIDGAHDLAQYEKLLKAGKGVEKKARKPIKGVSGAYKVEYELPVQEGLPNGFKGTKTVVDGMAADSARWEREAAEAFEDAIKSPEGFRPTLDGHGLQWTGTSRSGLVLQGRFGHPTAGEVRTFYLVKKA